MEARSDSRTISGTSAGAGVFSSLYAPTPKNLDFLAGILRAGGLVGLPTETVYGLAADATNEAACRRIFELKQRPRFDPLIVHVSDLSMARRYARIEAFGDHLAHAFWPGPLTLVLPRTPLVPDEVTSGLETVAIRCPAHPLFRELLRRVERGLAAPSANPFGYISPTTAEHVAQSFGRKLSYILDGGPCPIGLESTIIDLTKTGSARVLRQGAVEVDAIVAEARRFDPGISIIVTQPTTAPGPAAPALAPGMLARHYSPRKRLIVYPYGQLPPAHEAPSIAHVSFEGKLNQAPNIRPLTEHGDGKRAAARLYALLRELDAEAWEAIYLELPPPGIDLAGALVDRLRRASAQE